MRSCTTTLRLRDAVLTAAIGLIFAIPAANAQTYVPPPDPTRETYVIDSKGTALFRDGVRVCHVNCGAATTPVYPRIPAGVRVVTPPAYSDRAAVPDRTIAADRYPLRPEELDRQASVRPAAPAAYPLPQQVFAPTTLQPSPAALAQAVPPDTMAPPPKSSSFTKEQKVLILNAGGVAAVTAYGIAFWDYFQTSPKADGEGWFGRTTKNGGADKLGHFWSTYAVGHLFSYLYRWWDIEPDQANTLGALSSLSLQTLMEVGDAFSADYGFSYEDAVMNLAGAGAAYILGKYPSLARKIDFRFEYRPQSFSDLTNDFLTNYDNQRYLVALKLDGFDVFHDSYLSYLELQAGYYARGYEEYNPGSPDNRRRNLYFGVGFNVSKLVRNFVDVGLFDYVQVPYTSVGAKKGLD